MSDQKEPQIKQIFDVLDKDHNGNLSVAEFGTAVRALGLNPTNSEIQDILAENDLDHDGTIDFEEFNRVYSLVKLGEKYDTEESKSIFELINHKPEDTVLVSEVIDMLQGEGEPLTDEEVKTIIQDFGKDKSGRINLAEFIQFLRSS